MTRFMGLDLHKNYIHGYVFQPGQKGTHFRFLNTPDEWARFVATQLTPETAVAIEATGNAFTIYDRLVDYVRQVVVIHPAGLKGLGGGRHTDRIDAERLAQLMALGTYTSVQVWVPPAEVRAIRALITQVRACQQQETAWRNRARNLLIRTGYAVPRTVALREWFAAQGAELDETLQIVFTSALTMAEQAQQEGDRLRGEILRRLAGYPEMAWLWSVPGLGAWTAAVVWAWLGDPQRFRSARQVGRYAGLDPSVHQSGEADWRGHISHQGPAILRQVLVEAAWWAIRAKDTPLRTFYARVVPRLGKRRAIVAVARKLLLAAWRVWHEQRLAHEVDRRRYQKKLSAIRAILRTVPSYPLTDRWQILTGAEGSAPDRAATEARGQPVLST
ncbi:Transposase [Sulfobacillus thermosulfidooxidans DSM 9293]|uniref:Transposase n=3 Tax=Sulfobacillus thermosulfidooxidans TaxID=28034 RepID=A0A1W1WFK7_SULTA|nr:IS110 family transposase [Sulfobacillus thermosulfidooxidans]PSR29565.1 MAG: IS110 family transposase [Sulfobacillus thermosulfidooxidans]SMC05091.1 Transposase [Sulfobacillus thermosulfidooxidans DSM 9293]